MAKQKILRCGFCNKTQHQIKLLIAGPEPHYICDECVDICVDILVEDNSSWMPEAMKRGKIDFKRLGIKPPFKTLRFEPRTNHCFHLCPFVEPFNTIYRDHISKTAKKCEFTIERADEIFGTGLIIEDIWQAIVTASVVIADVTGRNPNVMYEIGMAHTVGKPVVIMTQNLDDVPFDLRNYRCTVYAYTPRGCAKLEDDLFHILRFMRDKAP